MRRRLTSALTVSALVLAGALGAATGAQAHSRPWPLSLPSSGSTVTVAPPATTVTARVGDTVAVQLTACAGSCGYVWKVTRAPDGGVVRYLSTSFTNQAPAGTIGGYQTQTVTYRATHMGSTSATFGYFPPGTGATAVQTYTLTFTVTDPNAFTGAAKTGPATAAGTVQLWRIRTASYGYFDRVVFDERNGTSAYRVAYVPKVFADPSGLPVQVRGRYFLQVTLSSTTTQVAPTYVPSVLNPWLARVMQIKKTGEFEQVVTFAIGLRQAHGFRVLQLTNPNRLVVDIRH